MEPLWATASTPVSGGGPSSHPPHYGEKKFDENPTRCRTGNRKSGWNLYTGVEGSKGLLLSDLLKDQPISH